jgi:hypothetical protein
MQRLLPLLLLVWPCLPGCSATKSEYHPPCETAPPDGQETCLTDHYFANAGESENEPCGFFVPGTEKIGGRREVGFFMGVGITDDDVVQEGRWLQRFYTPYELSFFSREPAGFVGFEFALNGTNAEFNDAARRAGVQPGVDPTAEQEAELNRLVGEIMFREVRSFVTAQSNPPKQRVNVVVLGHITGPDIAKQLNGVIGGLGLSPRLLRDIAEGDANKNLFEILALPDDFTPTLLLGHDDIERLAANVDGIVAHEMGHALGLQHTTEAGNLMTQGQATKACRPGLTNQQIEQLREAATTAGPTETGLRRALDAHRSVVRRLLGRQ